MNPVNIFSHIFIFLDLAVVFFSVRMAWLLLRNKHLGWKSNPFFVEREHPAKKVLFIGDSTSVGTGAEKPEDSIAGRLAGDIPTISISNDSGGGFRTRDLIKVLKKRQAESFDLVIISVGGNDVWHFSALGKLRRDLSSVLEMANEISSNRTILLVYSNIGSAPLFPWIIRRILDKRAKKVRDIFFETAREKGVRCVDLCTRKKAGLTSASFRMYFARDMIHPSSEGYGVWYKEMWKQLMINDRCSWPSTFKKQSWE